MGKLPSSARGQDCSPPLFRQEEIKVDFSATVKICWGAFDEGRQQYYGEAGVLQFSSPTFMADAGVYLTTRLQGGVGQAVLSFSPSTGTTFYKAFHTPLVAPRRHQLFEASCSEQQATLRSGFYSKR